MRFRPTLRLVAALICTAAVPFVAGCDTTDPVPPAAPEEVAGTYDFAEFRFVPTSSGIVPLNLLDTLITDETQLDLAANGEFQLVYRLEGSTFSDNVRGTFNASRDEVVLSARAVDVARLEALLLRQQLTFTRTTETELLLSDQRTVDLESFDDERYGGLDAVTGALRLRLVLRDEPGT